MNLASVLHAKMMMGVRATELDILLESHGDEISEAKKQSWTEVRDVLHKGERTIELLLRERENLCAYIHNEMKTVEYNKNLLKSIIEEKVLL